MCVGFAFRVKGVQAIPVTVKPQITFQDGEGRVSIMVSSSQRGGLPQQLHSHNSSNHNHSHNLQQSITDALSSAGGTSSKPVDSLSLTVHLPQSVATCDLTANVGSVLFDSVSKVSQPKPFPLLSNPQPQSFFVPLSSFVKPRVPTMLAE